MNVLRKTSDIHSIWAREIVLTRPALMSDAAPLVKKPMNKLAVGSVNMREMSCKVQEVNLKA